MGARNVNNIGSDFPNFNQVTKLIVICGTGNLGLEAQGSVCDEVCSPLVCDVTSVA